MLLLSVVVGITTTVILFCSHWHQIQGDIAAGKMSPLVRLGTANACKVGG
jgi:1,4-dihydroxy-2-naphthoate octaprenyltransferase